MRVIVTRRAQEMFNSDLLWKHQVGAVIKLAHQSTPMEETLARAVVGSVQNGKTYRFVPDWEGRVLVFSTAPDRRGSGTVVTAVFRVKTWLEETGLPYEELDDILLGALREGTVLGREEAEYLTDHRIPTGLGTPVLSPDEEWVVVVNRCKVTALYPVLEDEEEAA